jgi:hypothetical protein
MIGPPPGTRVYLACGVTDMRRGKEPRRDASLHAFRDRKGGW